MKKRIIIVGIALLVCISALMVAPVAASQGCAKQSLGNANSQNAENGLKLQNMAESDPARNQVTQRMKVAACIKNCPDDVWSIISEHRMSIFDLRVDTAESLITLHEEKGFNVDEAVETLDEIKEKRDDLGDALQSKDKDEIKSIYKEINSLWKDLRKHLWGWLKTACCPADESAE
jgi:hypothetical protein